MSLATRLKKLEAPVRQAWQEAWENYMEAVLDICPEEALDAYINLYTEDMDAAADEKVQRELPALLTQLSLDADAWLAWLEAYNHRNPTHGDLTCLPQYLPAPPEGDLAGALSRVTGWRYEGEAGAARAYLVLSLHEAVVLRERYG